MRIATDGSCLKNPGGKTGWAWVAENGIWQSGSVAEGSNNIGELMAAIAALRASKNLPEVHLEIDSQYVLNIIQKWGPGWKKRGWKKANGEPVANVELVDKLLTLSNRRGLTMEWVKGHNGHWLNEFADEQAGLAAKNQTPPRKGRYTEEEIADAILKPKPKTRTKRVAKTTVPSSTSKRSQMNKKRDSMKNNQTPRKRRTS